MRRKRFARALAVACTAAAFQVSLGAQQRGQPPANLTERQWLDSREAQAHVTAAMAIAKPDLLPEAANLCSARGPQRPAVLRQEAALPTVPRQTLEPTKIFDNLYCIGFNHIGAWALKTSQGIIVFKGFDEFAGRDSTRNQTLTMTAGHSTSRIAASSGIGFPSSRSSSRIIFTTSWTRSSACSLVSPHV
jgi:hypothetical protein